MNLITAEKGESVVTNVSLLKKNVLRIVVTDGTTEITLALLYRILSDNTFGHLITLFRGPGVTYGHDESVAFKDADVVFCIGSAREYVFREEEYNGPFFKEYVRVAKFYGECIEKYAKKDARIIVLGNTAATIISRYAKSIPPKNITALAMFNLKMAATHIAERANCLPIDVKNIVIWGNNNCYSFPDCRYVYFANGKPVSDELIVWMRTSLQSIMRKVANRPRYIRSMACGLADHCKFLWNGTPENEWTCMGVLSDHSYDIRAGIFFSYPVFCKNGEYEIVKGLVADEYVRRYILDLSRLIFRDVAAAISVCNRQWNN
ncbi:uncharacterized protein LOC128894530 [Hylaeus anthracinus]|uniref:uncharacterized protein LOC128894530 n=1 Tax=Hylaeus anthracinus TaxID=313031 RepID=UPI0023B9C4DC|nr:uncharacterized protein LOC128894530 [Hylaeus anthracinus]